MSEKAKGFFLQDRDVRIMKLIYKFKFLLGRQIRMLAGFAGESTCDARLSKLIKNEYLNRKKILYGVPSLYYLGRRAKEIPEVKYYQFKVSPSELHHDIAVIDTAIYMCEKYKVNPENIVTETQLHSYEGFGVRSHQPDLVIKTAEGKSVCIEVEFSPKNKVRFQKNLSDNFKKYDVQVWVVPEEEYTVIRRIQEAGYPEVYILSWEVVKHATNKSRRSGK
jgi:hypothetical protein